ncbi:potassium/sodium hyperpolarization-activated cyclic nucleotide-gated channel 2-like [Pieris napi]|uniref:potassium/sodium hyperpolarization-activated cyclic nucleotide-gated channel 2-like n=1 Tax=Pieris napi TaxID=78633 RepID=UPI001FB87BF6|nr:potassium/sodium hyperpolarization-activated cyclic nucleotide-gated channel 2-like [Pieris napi]
MYGRLLFGESFYEHACLVMHEKDVLDLELSGNSWFKRLRRSWEDLFLLSYKDERAQAYYTSRHALRMERAKQFYIYRKCIHPLSKFRQFWDYAIVPIVILNMIIFYHSTSLTYGEAEWQFYMANVFLESLLFLDIYYSLRTGYVHTDSKRIILNSKKILLHYASTKLFFHVLASFPIQTIMFMRYGRSINCAICKANKFIIALQFICIFRMYRLIDATSQWSTYRRSVQVTCWLKFLRIAILCFISMHILMRIADIISVHNILSRGSLSSHSFYASVLSIRYGRDPPPTHVFYCLDFARICKSFRLFSFSLTPNAYFPDKMTSLLAYLVAMMFYMWSLVECYFLLSYLKYPEDQMYTCVDRTLTLSRWRRLPDSFSEKLLTYYKFNMTKLTVTERQNGLYRSLPKSLKNEIAISCNSRLLMRIQYFAEWPSELIEQLVMCLKEEIYLTGDVVAESSIPSDGLMIIVVGVLAIYSTRDEEVGHLVDGDYFCELCLVTDREIRMSSVIALTACKILFLEKITFRKLLRSYPELFYKLKDLLTEKYTSQRQASINPLPVKSINI